MSKVKRNNIKTQAGLSLAFLGRINSSLDKRIDLQSSVGPVTAGHQLAFHLARRIELTCGLTTEITLNPRK